MFEITRRLASNCRFITIKLFKEDHRGRKLFSSQVSFVLTTSVWLICSPAHNGAHSESSYSFYSRLKKLLDRKVRDWLSSTIATSWKGGSCQGTSANNVPLNKALNLHLLTSMLSLCNNLFCQWSLDKVSFLQPGTCQLKNTFKDYYVKYKLSSMDSICGMLSITAEIIWTWTWVCWQKSICNCATFAPDTCIVSLFLRTEEHVWSIGSMW